MANKYTNLVGTNKIKDEYTKINMGFDEVEADINALDARVDTIITTPIEGAAAAQEIVDARVSAVKSKTFATLDARFEESEQDLVTHKAENVTDADGAHGLKVDSGTFTPYVCGSGVAGANTYTVQKGNYYKINKTIDFNLHLIISAKDANMAGPVFIGGLPFVNSANFVSVIVGSVENLNLTSVMQLVARMNMGASSIYLRKANLTGASSALNQTEIGLLDIMISGTYQIS